MTAARRALCVLCAALCGAVARANITAEDDEIQVELTNETSVVSVCALSNLLSGVSVSSGSLYRGVSNLPSVANYTVNQTSDGLRRAVAAIEHARGAVSRLAGSEGADADEVQRAKAAVADADKAHAAATKQRTALPPSRASCPPTWRARSCTQGPQRHTAMPP
ncbi:hypothetical protein ERJ75_000105800 [Trypanosoma vivax]|nr:hypothetical protein ERJ75_000105800 [Trypanosoma vivax]